MRYEWVADFARTGEVSRLICTRWIGKPRLTDTYRWPNDLPLRDSDNALKVGWCELTTTDPGGQVLYRNAWASSRPIDPAHVVAVAAGRRRWKIENENHDTLKTKGYRCDHHYGHGQQHRAAVLASLILLAFLLHTVLERYDPRYQAVRHHLPSRRTCFEHLRVPAQYLPFASWDHLRDFRLEALQPAQPPPPRQASAHRRQI